MKIKCGDYRLASFALASLGHEDQRRGFGSQSLQ